MIDRCYNEKCSDYGSYGLRGIDVNSYWRESVSSFVEWSLENGWKKGLEIDRINNDKGYHPDNCRFVTHKINSKNKRLLQSNNKSGYCGASFCRTHKRWKSYITYDRARVNIGSFSNSIDAAVARDSYIISNNLLLPLNFEQPIRNIRYAKQ
jgi:hypothetical protein